MLYDRAAMIDVSEPGGLICAYLLDGRGGGEQLSWPSIEAWTPEQGILWLYLDYKGERSERWLAEDSGVDPLIREALLAQDPRPRCLATSDDGLMLIIRGVNLERGEDPEDMVSMRMWCDQHRVICMRHRRVGAMKAVHRRIMSGKGPATVGQFVLETITEMLDRIAMVADTLEDTVAEIEDGVVKSLDVKLRHQLADLRRQAIALRRYVAPQRDVLASLQGVPVTWLSELDRVRLREQAERLTRVIDELDAARDRAAVTHEEVASRLSEIMNQRLYTLSVLTAIFLPLGVVTGLWGANVGGIPLFESSWGFVILAVSMVGLSGLQLWLFRKLRWL
jgi:zinc transporter